METFGRQLEKLRKYLNLTQEEFGYRIGVKKAHISAVENDMSSFSIETLQSVCSTFKVDARFFFGQLNSIEESDLSNKKENSIQEFIKTIRDQEKEINRLKNILESGKSKELTLLLAESPVLNNIIKKIKDWNPQMLMQIEAFIKGVEVAAFTKNDLPPS